MGWVSFGVSFVLLLWGGDQLFLSFGNLEFLGFHF